MVLKDYQVWIDEVYNYWKEKIENNTTISDSDKTNLLSTLDKKADEFVQSVETYKSNFPVDDFKKLIISYFAFYSTGVISKIDEIQPPEIPTLEKNIYYYTFELPEDYDTLFSIEQVTDSSTGATTAILITDNIDALISDILSLDDSQTFKKRIDEISNYGSDVAIAKILGNKKPRYVEDAPSFEEFANYKQVCKDFNVNLPGVKL